ncbi:phytanoyl-CoA dioxygenase family protein [Novosphingobium sp. fls2-241-R2A-195]|jgi:hypothetical protein|uniref:phytanoyl-CoA dioxygenase family protein n=1 Tax=Novosphingobium sp. fls2-241-R2A-195 TaxID=3040296 RepID=UPI00254B5801|nr:phytanoyl-CoA dioxygenase family protein [Novosphingobium sp. fls2-241-R2A-195]
MTVACTLAELDLDRDGVKLHPGLALPMLAGFETVLGRMPDGRAGLRIAAEPELATLLGVAGPVSTAVRETLGEGAQPVRAVLFDKNDEAGWALGWHQDRTIAVLRKVEAPGFGPWTVKQGITHVEPPFAVIEGMLTVRIHLDPVDAENAPLLVASSSHRLGRIPAAEAEAVAARLPNHVCLAKIGDVWFYRTPILHASNAARPGRRRRVLQVDYAIGALPFGLEWLGI